MNKEMIEKAVKAQALDEGLWFQAEWFSEDYLQMALRDLHLVIEDEDEKALQRIINRVEDP